MNTPNTTKEKILEEKTVTEAAIFFAEIEKNLPKTQEMAAVGTEKIYRAFYPAYIEFRKHLLDQVISETRQETIKESGYYKEIQKGVEWTKGFRFALMALSDKLPKEKDGYWSLRDERTIGGNDMLSEIKQIIEKLQS